MFRFLLKLTICLGLAIAAGLILLALRSGDVVYTAYEWLSPARFHQFDNIIRAVAAEHGIDPMLVKAVVWRESRFDPRKVGSAGERGLMQVSERAAREWARETQVSSFNAQDLLDAKTNLEAGTWYLHRALEHWNHQKKPAVFALAEYNAGASRAQRWANNDPQTAMSERTFRNNIDFPGTRNYVRSVLERYEFYRKRGRM
ncbi:MAG TPA: lytic transglycosylase domain-containing protein [Chthoniobacterales bacterium]|jgi:soluble lytic murein transglycosylase|nr:MAG: murein transglycosylase [Verrucomicrobiota bacterium]